MSRIITNYSLENTKDDISDDNKKSLTPIIKVPIFKTEEKKIEAFEIKQKEVEKKEPRLQLTRNSEGVIVGIEVKCSCDETILIKLDY